MQATSLQVVVDEMNRLCDEKPYPVGWYLKDLRSGFVANRNGDVMVPSASTRKVAILMTALKAVHEGRLRLDQPVPMEAKYQDNTSGVFQHLQPGFTIQFRDALIMMIIVSDNTCTGTVADMVGLDKVQALCDSIGMKGTAHRLGIPTATQSRDLDVSTGNATTPADVGLLLEMIVNGAADESAAAMLGCTSELCRLALDIMSWQKLTNRIPYLLPEGTKVASKTGSVPGNYHDVGIVFQGGQPLYILTAYNTNVPAALPDGTPAAAAASLLIARMSRLVWDALAQ